MSSPLPQVVSMTSQVTLGLWGLPHKPALSSSLRSVDKRTHPSIFPLAPSMSGSGTSDSGTEIRYPQVTLDRWL